MNFFLAVVDVPLMMRDSFLIARAIDDFGSLITFVVPSLEQHRFEFQSRLNQLLINLRN